MLRNILEVFQKRDKDAGLLWAVVIMWSDFLFLYWSLQNSYDWGTNLGLFCLALACALVLYFG